MNDVQLRVPEIASDTDVLTAALVYTKAGWYAGPTDPRIDIKNPGTVLFQGWPRKTSRNPKQITAWFAGTAYGLFLHCGRSGVVVFDVDDPSRLPEVLRKHLATAPYQSTRPDVPGRGHYIFTQPQGRTIGNGLGRLNGGWGEVRGLNGVIIAAPTPHPNGGLYEWVRTGPVPVLPGELAELLDDGSPAEDAVSDAAVTAFIAEHNSSTRPEVLRGIMSALRNRFDAGQSRHQSTTSVLTGAMKEARIGLYTAQGAIDMIRAAFIEAVKRPPSSGKQSAPRDGDVAASEFDGILAWAVAQALAADPDEIRARVDEKMPNNVEWVDRISDAPVAENAAEDTAEDETVKTVPWPTLSPTALHGTAGRIVELVAPHTEADPAALLVQLLAEFGVTLGPGPHITAGNDRHQTVIHPLIVGRTNSGAKGTGLGVIEAVRRQALPWFDEFTTSGLSSAEGLIEMVRDPSGDPGDKDYDPGVADKRLLVKETEYRSVLARCRREGNTLTPTLRQVWDGGTLRTLTRKHNKLTATDPHIVVIGHITPREFRATLDDSDLSGGSVNRLLICLSRRSQLHARLGNIPEPVLTEAGRMFGEAQKKAQHRGRVEVTDEFWSLWDAAYRELNRDRPDSWATDATARGVTQVLRLALLYALFDSAEKIDANHLEAATALWDYAEHSARWLFSSHEQEVHRQAAGGLAAFIRDGGPDGRTRTEISRDYFKGNKPAAEITAELTPLVHDGVVIEVRDETAARPITRYIHRTLRINEFTNYAGQGNELDSYPYEFTNSERDQTKREIRKFVDGSYNESCSDLQNSLNSLIRSPNGNEATNPTPPGGVTASTPGVTDRVQQILAKADRYPRCTVCDKPVTAGQGDRHFSCTQEDGAFTLPPTERRSHR